MEEKELEKRREALILAEERMQEVSVDVRKETGLRLAERAAEIFGEITGGRYPKIFIEEELEISIFDGVRKIPLHMMSRGTIEQIYFAIRMAASEILYEESWPILLDDTLHTMMTRGWRQCFGGLPHRKTSVLSPVRTGRKKHLTRCILHTAMDGTKSPVRCGICLIHAVYARSGLRYC